jgi:NADH:ubiquinone oxidoreductase subunit D
MKKDLNTGEYEIESAQPDALELKTSEVGVLSKTTRGQMGVGGTMIAATGFEKKH